MAWQATPQLYGLFELVNVQTNQWVRRLPACAYEKLTAVRIFQNALLAPYLGVKCGVRELRAVGHVLPRR